jgi:predicted dehydrogenase
MKELGIGIIGTGFMGKAHAFAYRAALAAFPEIPVPRLEMIADVDAASASSAQASWARRMPLPIARHWPPFRRYPFRDSR